MEALLSPSTFLLFFVLVLVVDGVVADGRVSSVSLTFLDFFFFFFSPVVVGVEELSVACERKFTKIF